MKKPNQIFIALFIVILMGCNVSPKPIDYGKEFCHFCKMTIVDKVHGAEIVTSKGKVYKFDAAECMIEFLKDFDESTIELYLTNHYSQPETLINATEAVFLISENMPSPMGANLTAFEKRNDAESVQKEKGGTLYSWQELLDHFK